MFNAVLLMLYVAFFAPKSSPMLASPLVMFTITFRRPCSSSGRYAIPSSAGPATFARSVSSRPSYEKLNAESSPSVYLRTRMTYGSIRLGAGKTHDGGVVVEVVQTSVAKDP